MCSLPNIQAQDLEEFSQSRKKQIKKIETNTVEIVMIPKSQLLENSI